ncbi:hypothetical protein ACGFY7_50110 [Streptomyces prunicolor]|uniref:hypothetical protein n=1 Tax=Streptomyces prunicolor TaxID=67348 RepID=UPI0037161D04
MRDEHVLGWYNLRGTAFVTLDVVRNPSVLATVVNHEATHHLLSATTPYGLIQQCIENYLDEPWATQENEPLHHCRNLLFAASRLSQEAAATYCGLADLEGEALTAAIAALPPYYLSAYGLIESILPHNELDVMSRFRTARAIACRALQTSIMRDWIPCKLHKIDNLSAYLAQPENSPDERLRAILGELAKRSTEQVTAWAGRHFQTSDGVRLLPVSPPPLADLEFSVPQALPLKCARRILNTLSVDIEDETDLMPLAFQEIVIEPDIGGVRTLQPEEVSTQSCSDTDFFKVDRNVFEGPMLFAGSGIKYALRPGHAKISIHRPDSQVPTETLAPLEDVPTILDNADPTRSATVCIGGLSTLPREPYDGKQTLTDIAKHIFSELLCWTSGRNLIIYTGGQQEGLYVSARLMELAYGRLQNHAMLLGREWGLVLFRSTDDAGPLVIHPTLASEWQRQLPNFTAVTEVDLNVDSATFYRGNPRNVLPVLRFARAFAGDMFTPEGWVEYSESTSASLATDPLYVVEPGLKMEDFDHDH